MSVDITEISSDTLNAMRDLARKQGKTLEQFARAVVEREMAIEPARTTLSNAEKIVVFEKWMKNLDANTPVLSDEQISRESIYEEQILRQL